MKTTVSKIPAIIWWVSLSNFFINLSSVMSFTYLPVYMTSVLGISMASLGLVEGIIDSSDLFTRIFSGYFSDKIKKRKVFISIGFIFATLSRFILSFSVNLGGLISARLLDRISHGFQASPRDALVGEHAPPSIQAKCYSLRYICTVLGNAVGALVSIFIMVKVTSNYQNIFFLSAIPAILGCLIFIFFVKDNPKKEKEEKNKITKSISLEDIKNFNKNYWILILSNFFFMTSAFGISFLIKEVENKGFPIEYLPVVMIIKNIVIVFSSLFFGNLADRFNKVRVVQSGLVFLILSHIIFSLSGSPLVTFLGICMAGLQWGILYGSLSSLISEYAPANLKSTAFGIFHFTSGISVLMGNLFLGYLWHHYGSSTAFLATSVGAFLAIGTLFFTKKKKTC